MSNWMLLLIVGVLSLIAGLTALFNPMAASITAEQIAGWSFLFLGALQVVEAIRAEAWGGKLWSLILGVLAAVLGLNLIANPMAGVIALTIILGTIILASGIFKIVVGLRIRANNFKWAVVISGAISAILGLMILTNIPGAATITLGVMLGIELVSNGISAISLALSRKSGGVESAA